MSGIDHATAKRIAAWALAKIPPTRGVTGSRYCLPRFVSEGIMIPDPPMPRFGDVHTGPYGGTPQGDLWVAVGHAWPTATPSEREELAALSDYWRDRAFREELGPVPGWHDL